jgi:hypothetical protein
MKLLVLAAWVAFMVGMGAVLLWALDIPPAPKP